MNRVVTLTCPGAASTSPVSGLASRHTVKFGPHLLPLTLPRESGGGQPCQRCRERREPVNADSAETKEEPVAAEALREVPAHVPVCSVLRVFGLLVSVKRASPSPCVLIHCSEWWEECASALLSPARRYRQRASPS